MSLSDDLQIENDWLETIVALPDQMFYNTGIGTFIWIITNRKEEKRKGKIQLIDCRDRWLPMKRSLANKRRYLDEEIIDAVTREHGEFTEQETSKIFNNDYFGYRRVTIDRPLRLKFQITDEAKELFLDKYSELEETLLLMESKLGDKPYLDWNKVLLKVQKIFNKAEITWAKGAKGDKQKKFFKDCFTIVDSGAMPVIANKGKFGGKVTESNLPRNEGFPKEFDRQQIDRLFGIYPSSNRKNAKTFIVYEPDINLRDYENIPLTQGIVEFFLQEVRPYVEDAWINAEQTDGTDGKIGKVGYEINFNREFFKYEAPRDLEVINAELAQVEKKILEMLKGIAI